MILNFSLDCNNILLMGVFCLDFLGGIGDLGLACYRAFENKVPKRRKPPEC